MDVLWHTATRVAQPFTGIVTVLFQVVDSNYCFTGTVQVGVKIHVPVTTKRKSHTRDTHAKKKTKTVTT